MNKHKILRASHHFTVDVGTPGNLLGGYNSPSGIPKTKRTDPTAVSPRQSGFICEKCGEPIERKSLNAHWKTCGRVTSQHS